jgi:A/G-specific adenine glycosylase
MEFSKSLINWYLQNKRDLPWRKTSDPYYIWLSEIMLQQTRVTQGLPYFLSFTEAFPTVFDLANAPEEQVLKLWQGLGYYSRARNLHTTAKYIAEELKGVFPPSYSELLKLKGVGDYTAAAIASIAYGEAVPVVDGNVYRVLSRYKGIATDISGSSAKKEFTALAATLLPKADASSFNQAMMEFGALQCVPRNPDCSVCVFKAECVAFNTGRVGDLPVKLKKTKVTNRYFNYLVLKDSIGNTLVNKRTSKGIWHNLYEFPLIETTGEVSFNETINFIEEKYAGQILPSGIKLMNADKIVHKLSHQHLSIHFWEVYLNTVIQGGLTPQNAKAYPFPIVIYNFMDKHWE